MTTKPDNELRIRQLEQQLRELRTVVDAMRLTNPNGQIDQIIRPARTCIPDPNDSGSEITITPGYPEAGHVVPIKFLDVNHGGLNTNVIKTERSASQQALAATLDGTLPDVDTDGVVFRYGTKNYFIGGGFSASSSVFACDNVFTFDEPRHVIQGDCLLIQKRTISLTIVNGCIDEIKTDWEDVARVALCNYSDSSSLSDDDAECPDCVEHKGTVADGTEYYIGAFGSSPKAASSVTAVDPVINDWCIDETRTFTTTIENTSPPDANPGREEFYFRALDGTTCEFSGRLSVTPGFQISSGKVQINSSEYPIFEYRQTSPGSGVYAWYEITSFPHEAINGAEGGFANSYAVQLPCEILARGESITFDIELQELESTISGNAQPVVIHFGRFGGASGGYIPIFGPQITYSCDPPPTGRCCKDGACTVTTEADCTAIGGTWTEGGNCSGPPCPI